jgi:hypothetical protein
VVDLQRRPVLLSASFPSGDRGDRFKPYDPDAVADAVTALVASVFASKGRLVFGGHPTITPLVLRMAADHGAREAVSVYQSEEFRDVITEPTRELERGGFGRIIVTPSSTELPRSLALMRVSMMNDNDDIIGGFFVGGMEGVLEEYAILGEVHPGVVRLPLKAPGGAAARLEPTGRDSEPLPSGVLSWLGSPHYPLVAAELVRFLAE